MRRIMMTLAVATMGMTAMMAQSHEGWCMRLAMQQPPRVTR